MCIDIYVVRVCASGAMGAYTFNSTEDTNSINRQYSEWTAIHND